MFEKKGREPKPEVGDYRIQEVVLKNGDISYEVQLYAWWFDMKSWCYDRTFAKKAAAVSYIQLRVGEQEASRRVVWP